MTDYREFGVQVICYLGDNDSPLDITRNIAEIAPITNTGLDLARIVILSGSLTLWGDRSFLETRNNLRWAKGNKVEIKIRNSHGAFVLHRTMRILDNFYNEMEQTLELPLGCLFALRDSRYPNPGDLDIPVLEARPDVLITTTINYWLQTFKLPQITVVPGDYVPSDRIFTTGLAGSGSSPVQHIGMIALNSDFELWIDPQERVRVRQLTLAPTVMDYTLDARDCEPYERATSEREKIAGTVRVMGVANYHLPYTDPPSIPSVTSENGLQTSESTIINTTPTSRTVTRLGTMVVGTAETGKIGQFREVTTESYEGGFAQQDNPNPVLPPIPGLPPWLTSRLFTLQEQRLQPDGKLGALQVTKTQNARYRYRRTSARHQGVMVRGVEIEHISDVTEILPEGEVTLRVEQVQTDDWMQIADGIYWHQQSVVRTEDIDNRRYTKNTPSIGASSPPATEHAPSMVIEKQLEIYGEAIFNYPIGAPDIDHPRDYNVSAYLDLSSRAKKLAEQLGALLIGRNEAQTLGFRPSDAWLANPIPRPIVAIVYNNIEQDVYLVDVLTTVFEEQSYIGGNGIWLGRRNIATGVITPPYGIKRKVIGRGTVLRGRGTKVFDSR